MQNSTFKVIILISLLILQGCASSGWKIEDAGIKTKTVSSEKLISFTSVVTEQPGGFSIFGEMKARRIPAYRIKGHIDVDILDSKGQILRTDVTGFHRFGKWRHAYIKYKYNIDVPQVPPNDGVIRVTHHEAGIH